MRSPSWFVTALSTAAPQHPAYLAGPPWPAAAAGAAGCRGRAVRSQQPWPAPAAKPRCPLCWPHSEFSVQCLGKRGETAQSIPSLSHSCHKTGSTWSFHSLQAIFECHEPLQNWLWIPGHTQHGGTVCSAPCHHHSACLSKPTCCRSFPLCIEMWQRGISRETDRFQSSKRLRDLFLDTGN